MTERKVKLDRANKSILLRALGDVYYGQRARGGSAEETGRLILRVNAKNGQAKSMRTLIASDKYEDIRYGFKFFAGNIGHEAQFYTFPYFCAFLLRRFMKDFRPQEESSD